MRTFSPIFRLTPALARGQGINGGVPSGTFHAPFARNLVNSQSVLARLFVAVLLSSLFALVPLAYASPPDPLWIPGIYDEGDLDFAVELALAECLELIASGVDAGRLSLMIFARVLAEDPVTLADHSIGSCQGRAPPIV
jgi:hypothetical protein